MYGLVDIPPLSEVYLITGNIHPLSPEGGPKLLYEGPETFYTSNMT